MDYEMIRETIEPKPKETAMAREPKTTEETTSTEQAPVRKSIIPPKYQGKYKGAEDWLASFIDGQVKVVPMKDKTVTEGEGDDAITKTITVAAGKAKLDLDKLFALSEANSIDAEIVKTMREQRGRKNAAGRIRMTLGNALRAAAKHRHGLYTIDGTWTDAPAEFIGDAVKTHNPDGSKIVVAKPATTEDSAKAEGEAVEA